MTETWGIIAYRAFEDPAWFWIPVHLCSSAITIGAWAVWFVLPTKRKARLLGRLGVWHRVLAIGLGLLLLIGLAIMWLPEIITLRILFWYCGIDVNNLVR